MAMSVEVPGKTDRLMTGQDRRLLALITEHFPFDSVSAGTKQVFINDKSGKQWEFLAKQMTLYTQAQADVKNLIINCNAAPSIPSGLTIHSHRKHGKLAWDKAKFAGQKFLYLSEGQKDGKVIVGTKLHEELKSKPVMNACVLDWLLANPGQIPESWKGRAIFFWGTIYGVGDSGGSLYVRCLYWRGTRWVTDCRWLAFDCSDGSPALLAK